MNQSNSRLPVLNLLKHIAWRVHTLVDPGDSAGAHLPTLLSVPILSFWPRNFTFEIWRLSPFLHPTGNPGPATECHIPGYCHIRPGVIYHRVRFVSEGESNVFIWNLFIHPGNLYMLRFFQLCIICQGLSLTHNLFIIAKMKSWNFLK